MNAERIIHLRVKVKSLAAEARIIRKESRKTRGMVKWRLNAHRTAIVRHHARHNQLAYGLLRGVLYADIEKKCWEKPDFEFVSRVAKRFGGKDTDVAAWITLAKHHLKVQLSEAA